MDEKHIPSPPIVSAEQYEADKDKGINRWGEGKPYDRTSWEMHRKACEAAGIDPDTAQPHYHEKVQHP